MLRTAEADCPQRLAPGDIVKASFKQHYIKWTVLTVENLDELRQKVTASAKGLGSVRFEWFGGHHRTGRGHGMTFYFEKSGTPPGWRPMSEASLNATWMRVILRNGTEERAHWASDLSGEYQPPYQGWFKQAGPGNHVQIENPVGWLPDER